MEKKSDKHADKKVEWSYTFFSERMAHTVESLDIPRQNHDTKKMPLEDQEDWLKACDEEMKSLADQNFGNWLIYPQIENP